MGSMLLYILIFGIGLFLGFLLRRKVKYGGAIVVTKSEDRILYSLELYDEVEKLEPGTDVTFKVISPEVDGDRN